MLKDILNNSAEYECRRHDQMNWSNVDITEGYHCDWEYRKNPPKTWLEESLEIFEELSDTHNLQLAYTKGAEEFYQEFMKRCDKRWADISWLLKTVAKEMGIE